MIDIGSHSRLGTLAAVAAVIVYGAAIAPAQATVTSYTSSSAFNAAIAGYTTTIEDYATGAGGQLIANGGSFNGNTYSVSGSTLLGSIITNQFNSFSGLSLGGNQSGGAQFFFGGNSVTVDFASPVYAAGVFFNVNANSGNYTLEAAGGTASASSAAFDTSTFVFDGIVSTTPFTTITFFSTDVAQGSYNIPEIITATPAPEPTSLAILGGGLAAIGWFGRRRS